MDHLRIYCLVSSQRTGSTIIIDYIQKMSCSLLGLSEIFYYYGNTTYTSSFDCINEKGILYQIPVLSLEELNNDIPLYFKQFTDYALLHKYQGLIFKLTLDFCIDNDQFLYLNDIIEFIQNYNIIYLDRNDLDIYISKKIAEKVGYANSRISEIEDIDRYNIKFDLNEFYFLLSNKNEFINKYMSKFSNIKYINYLSLTENIQENTIFINTILDSFYPNSKIQHLKYNKDIHNTERFNQKQNMLNNSLLLCNMNYWIHTLN